ncbi:alpha/beta hydrolase [Streptomyces sp. H27-C3]|uniref:alpha/beta hydrolase n=1 Tax=Streptomyces sp. H27-C3 TaxID=3046305 RepID=UPI0024B9D210|nr:alpha/beta hydrolase [Streptomyces sp. H27-C3]MDJ0466223.1 alpha/beta hydrolase [Streptomyces sp. H27-C3]
MPTHKPAEPQVRASKNEAPQARGKQPSQQGADFSGISRWYGRMAWAPTDKGGVLGNLENAARAEGAIDRELSESVNRERRLAGQVPGLVEWANRIAAGVDEEVANIEGEELGRLYPTLPRTEPTPVVTENAFKREHQSNWTRYTCDRSSLNEGIQKKAGFVRDSVAAIGGKGHTLLVCDPGFEDGLGRAALAVGDMDTADYVAVLVPGMGSSLETLPELARHARSLYEECLRISPGAKVAIVAWMGYKAPRSPLKGTLEVTGEEPARKGAELLRSDLNQWRVHWQESPARNNRGLPTYPLLTISGLSYGSVVAGHAVAGGALSGALSSTVSGATRGAISGAVTSNPVTAAVTGALRGETAGERVSGAARGAVSGAVRGAVVGGPAGGATTGAARGAAGGALRSATAVGALSGAAPDNLILLGSPGTGRRPQHLDVPSGSIFVAANDSDAVSMLDWFSIDPTHKKYGDVTRMRTGYQRTPGNGPIESAVKAHTSYYNVGTESLTNIARVVVGKPQEVTSKEQRTRPVGGGYRNPLGRAFTNSPIKSRKTRSTSPESGTAVPSDPVAVSSADTDDDLINPLLNSQKAESVKDRAQAAQDYVDGIVRKVLREVVPSADTGNMSLDEKFTVTFLEAPATGGTGLRTTERYTLRELALGVPYRRVMLRLGLSVTIHQIEPIRSDFPSAVSQALKQDRIRSGVSGKFSKDADRMAADDAFKTTFSEFSRSRLRGRMNRCLAESKDPRVEFFAYMWLAGDLKEGLVEFQGKVVPDVVAIGFNDFSLLVSLATGETYMWRKDDSSSGFQKFIKGHLSEFDSAATRSGDFIPHLPPDPRVQGGNARTQFTFMEPRISFRQVPDIFDELCKASVQRVKSNLNGYVYTKAEEDGAWTAQFGRAAMQGGEILMVIVASAMSGGAGAVAAFGSGLGFGFGSAHFNRKIAENADRGDVYRQAMVDAELDTWLAVGMSAIDFKAAFSGIRTGVKGARSTAVKLIGDGMAVAREKVLLSQLAPRPRAARIGSKGAGTQAFTDRVAANGAGCWDAVADVQHMAGVITPQELSALRSVRAHSFENYLGGAGKEIANTESLARLAGGYRVAFVVDDGGRPNMIHAMLSTGDGRLAGLNNAGIRQDLSPGFAEIDFTNGGPLSFADGGFQLPDGRRVRIYAETNAPEFQIETRRPAVADQPQNAVDSRLAEKALADLRRQNAVNTMINNPAQNCENLITPTRNYMKTHGFTAIKYRGMAIWDNALEASHANHYVVVGNRGGSTYVFDLSAGQFANRGMRGFDGPVITTEAKWAKMYQDGTTRKLIKYQDFATSQEAKDAVRPTKLLAPKDYLPGATVLTSPNWY